MSRIRITATLSFKGQLTIPKYIRERYNLKRGSRMHMFLKKYMLRFMISLRVAVLAVGASTLLVEDAILPANSAR